MHCRVRYSLEFDLKIRSGQVWKICNPGISRGTLSFMYGKLVSSNTSRLEAHAGFFRLLMKGIFDPLILTHDCTINFLTTIMNDFFGFWDF